MQFTGMPLKDALVGKIRMNIVKYNGQILATFEAILSIPAPVGL